MTTRQEKLVQLVAGMMANKRFDLGGDPVYGKFVKEIKTARELLAEIERVCPEVSPHLDDVRDQQARIHYANRIYDLELALDAERERCANIAEEFSSRFGVGVSSNIAAAIRAGKS